MNVDDKTKIGFLQSVVLGELAAHLKMFDLLDVKDAAARIRETIGESNAAQMVQSFGITTPDRAFEIFADFIECADWKSKKEGNKYTITTDSCKFVGICKQLDTSHPCDMYCLKPMFQMVHYIDPEAIITTKGTLYDGDGACTIEIITSKP